MPKLKQLPRNAYETLCAELARATTTPFGAWCALGGREAVGYVTHADFAQAAERCERIGVTVFDELASYLRMAPDGSSPQAMRMSKPKRCATHTQSACFASTMGGTMP